MRQPRASSGLTDLDECLGGGFLPGTLVVVVGATGIGKTQLGLHFAAGDLPSGGPAGSILDLTSRGDAQGHAAYASRICNWPLREAEIPDSIPLDRFFAWAADLGDYHRAFHVQGRRVTRRDLEAEPWDAWQAQLNQRLQQTIAFLYGRLVHGCRRFVVDGIEPVERVEESIQWELLEYVYHQVLRKEADWVARDLFRQAFRSHAAEIAAHGYPCDEATCLVLETSGETMLERLIERPLAQGDALSGANTIILLGRHRFGDRLGRGLYIAKHRGSACDERILEYQIGASGWELV